MREFLTPILAAILRLGGSSGPLITSGTGSPEGVLSAPVGSIYVRTDGDAMSSTYRKESGSGSTGWVALVSITVGTTAPTSPVSGQVWIDTN